MIRPIRPALRCRSRVGLSYPSTSRAASTVWRVVAETPALPLRTRLTVASLTPACAAMSESRAVVTIPEPIATISDRPPYGAVRCQQNLSVHGLGVRGGQQDTSGSGHPDRRSGGVGGADEGALRAV